jgi:leucyl/phenylalanyl-tRNA---protein transferase
VPVYALSRALAFPPPDEAVEGLLAVGGDLSIERLLLAYRSGIFPWYDDGLPILWHSPDPRCVFRVDALHVGRTLRRARAKGTYEVRFDTAFEEVIRSCKVTRRPGQDGTWITREMERAYVKLHRLGYAHSVEAWEDSTLVGGLYGVSIGRMFFGESMFAMRPNASKLALVVLAERLAGWGFRVIDAQVPTPHTLSMGAEEWPRARFLDELAAALRFPTHKGNWGCETETELEPPA